MKAEDFLTEINKLWEQKIQFIYNAVDEKFQAQQKSIESLQSEVKSTNEELVKVRTEVPQQVEAKVRQCIRDETGKCVIEALGKTSGPVSTSLPTPQPTPKEEPVVLPEEQPKEEVKQDTPPPEKVVAGGDLFGDLGI